MEASKRLIRLEEFRRVPIRADVVMDIATRLDAVRGAARCLSRTLEASPEYADDVSVALLGVADQVTAIMLDLDVCAWPGAPKARARKE